MKRETPEWKEAQRNAFFHPSGLLCYRGDLHDWPGYTDENHPRELAGIALARVDGMIKGGRHLNPAQSWLLIDSYRIYLEHCRAAGIRNPERKQSADALLFEPLRQSYQNDTGRLLLPFRFHYMGDDELVRLLVEDTRIEPLFKLEYHQRRQRMNQASSLFWQWWGSRTVQFPTLSPHLETLKAA